MWSTVARTAESGHLADVDEVVGKDAPGLADEVGGVSDRDRRDVLEIRRDTADAHGPAEHSTDPVLEQRPPALESILEERLILGEPERHDGAIEADGST